MAEKILVTGATGKVGRELVPFLLEAGLEVKAGTRDPEGARALFPPQVEVVELNYGRTETYDAALTWADRVFLMPPPFSPDAHEAMAPFLDWAVSTKVEHLVLLTAMSAPEVDDLALRKLERHLEAQDTAHTILRPNLYMQNFHPGFISRQIVEDGRIRLPAGRGRVSLVDVRDVAEVAARSLTTRDHFGRSHTLTGGEALSLEEVARTLSAATGREIRYESVSDDDFRALLADERWRPQELEVVLDLFGSIRNDWRAPVHGGVERVLGRPPRTFREFAREHAPAWG
jgi:uncharacterized protein YbjT (DUF2867 family)